jgi:hypothetical protein
VREVGEEILMSKILTAIAVLSFYASAIAADAECTFDQANQIEVLREMSARHPGGTLDIAQRKLSWEIAGGRIDYQYGGCVHLGTIVSQLDSRATARNQEEIFRVARQLAATYWDTAVTEILVNALQRKKYVVDNSNDRTAYAIAHEDYTQLYIEHSHADKVDRVTIGWTGNF